jgi:hypothetical protein
MKKICLFVVGIYASAFNLFAQDAVDTGFARRKLKFEEANIVSSYYHQDGNKSAVTGGIGTERLTDIANVIDLKLVGYDYRQRKHSLTLEAGIDTYTSASSDMVDAKANSSASSHDVRFYPSVAWSVENNKKGTTFGLNTSFSKEFDYTSFGIGSNFNIKSKNNNREFGIKAQAYLDKVSLVYPNELIPTSNTVSSASSSGHEGGYGRFPTSSRNTLSASLSYSQVVTKNFQVMFLADFVSQSGYLSLPFHRVYFNNGSEQVEQLPSSRLKLPLGVRANYFLGDRIILRSFYRFYKDDWGITAHTIDVETAIKISPFMSVSPFYRYYQQTAAKYFAPYGEHSTSDAFYTSNYDLSQFHSDFFGAGIRFAPVKGVAGMQHVSMLELRFGHYLRSTDLNSNIVSMNLKFK